MKLKRTLRSKDLKLPISEIYYCLQGEGPFLGEPSILVRTEGCNLRCSFCDTKYAAYIIRKRSKPQSFFGIMTSIRMLSAKHSTNNIILTGGEPLIHKDTELFLQELLLSGYHITIETNGTIPLSTPFIKFMQDFKDRIYFAVSPKLSSSDPKRSTLRRIHSKLRINLGALRTYSSNGKFSFFKFVIKDTMDMREILELQRQVGFPLSNICLMPEGRTRGEIRRTRRLTYELCLEYGVRYSPRLQVDVYGAKKRV